MKYSVTNQAEAAILLWADSLGWLFGADNHIVWLYMEQFDLGRNQNSSHKLDDFY